LIPYTLLDTSTTLQGDVTTELHAISATIGDTQINVFNIYIPPGSSCPPRFKPNFSDLFTFANSSSETIILADFNAHNAMWFSAGSQDVVRGDDLANAIDVSNFCTLNLDFPTRLTANSSPSSPDLSIIFSHLLLTSNWSTNVRLNSDHLPITICLADDIPLLQSHRTFTNFRLANWAGFCGA
jgi:hypothetical protein